MHLPFDVRDGARRLDVEGDRLTGHLLDGGLSVAATTGTEHTMQGRLLLGVVACECATVLDVLA